MVAAPRWGTTWNTAPHVCPWDGFEPATIWIPTPATPSPEIPTQDRILLAPPASFSTPWVEDVGATAEPYAFVPAPADPLFASRIHGEFNDDFATSLSPPFRHFTADALGSVPESLQPSTPLDCPELERAERGGNFDQTTTRDVYDICVNELPTHPSQVNASDGASVTPSSEPEREPEVDRVPVKASFSIDSFEAAWNLIEKSDALRNAIESSNRSARQSSLESNENPRMIRSNQVPEIVSTALDMVNSSGSFQWYLDKHRVESEGASSVLIENERDSLLDACGSPELKPARDGAEKCFETSSREAENRPNATNESERRTAGQMHPARTAMRSAGPNRPRPNAKFIEEEILKAAWKVVKTSSAFKEELVRLRRLSELATNPDSDSSGTTQGDRLTEGAHNMSECSELSSCSEMENERPGAQQGPSLSGERAVLSVKGSGDILLRGNIVHSSEKLSGLPQADHTMSEGTKVCVSTSVGENHRGKSHVKSSNSMIRMIERTLETHTGEQENVEESSVTSEREAQELKQEEAQSQGDGFRVPFPPMSQSDCFPSCSQAHTPPSCILHSKDAESKQSARKRVHFCLEGSPIRFEGHGHDLAASGRFEGAGRTLFGPQIPKGFLKQIPEEQNEELCNSVGDGIKQSSTLSNGDLRSIGDPLTWMNGMGAPNRLVDEVASMWQQTKKNIGVQANVQKDLTSFNSNKSVQVRPSDSLERLLCSTFESDFDWNGMPPGRRGNSDTIRTIERRAEEEQIIRSSRSIQVSTVKFTSD